MQGLERLRPPRWFAAVVAMLSVCLLHGHAAAEGMQGHMFVTEEAVARLETPALKALLEARRDHYFIGSIFPDSGYWAQHAYGEEAHWEPFVEGYLAWIRAHYSPPYDQGEAADHVAVLMGIASHVMSDQVFDILFLDKVGEVSGADPKGQLDTHIDFFLVNDRSRKINPNDVANAEVLSGVLRDRLGIDAPVDTIRGGISRAKAGIAGVSSTGFLAGPMRAINRWASDNYLSDTVPGAYPHNARVIAGYFEVLWRRLHGQLDWDRLIAGGNPVAHGRDHGVNHQSLDSFVTLFVGDPLRAASLGERFRLVDSAGSVVPTTMRTRRDEHQESTTLQLRPAQNLAYNSWYRVLLAPGVQTVRGDVLDRELGFWFKTMCPPAPEACPDVPEPTPDEPEDAGAPELDGGPVAVDAGEAEEPDGSSSRDAGDDPEPADAAVGVSDGGGGTRDAGEGPSQPHDAGQPGMVADDGGASVGPDAGAGADGGQDLDESVDPLKPGKPDKPHSGGCGCLVAGGTGNARGSLGLVSVLLFGMVWRRRSRGAARALSAG